MRKHRQKMVFGAIRRLDDAFLLLKLFLDTPSLCHASGKCHRRYGKHCCPRLHREQRLILTLTSKRAESVHCSPHSDYGQNKNTCGSFALSETERGPNHNWAANESDGIIFRRDLQPPAKNNCTQYRQQQKQNANFQRFLFLPHYFPPNAPKQNQRSENEVARYIA